MPALPALPSRQPSPTPELPLLGLTVLAVEDSRFASEALRLLCQHSGARLRRADCLAAAHRHLRVYRPDVMIVDLGLPDGPGEDLLREMARGPARPPVLLATSGNPDLAAAALTAGADGFLEKPPRSLAAFQRAVLGHLRLPAPATTITDGAAALLPAPDPAALRDDLAHAAEILAREGAHFYLAHFLGGIARSAADPQLADAAQRLGPGQPGRAKAAEQLSALLHHRLATADPLWGRTGARALP